MAAGLVDTFRSALDDLDVECSRTSRDRFHETLESAIDSPAVAAPLPFDDLSLPDDLTVAPSADELREANTGVTAAGLGIAEYGSLVIQSRPGGDEPVSLYPGRHVAVLRETDLVAGIPEAIERLGDEFDAGRDSAVLATGISATADMGETVYGVHGPRAVHVVLVTDDQPTTDDRREEP